jgi:hypothetical protein
MPRHFVRSLAKGSVDFFQATPSPFRFSYRAKQAGSQLFRALFFFFRALSRTRFF